MSSNGDSHWKPPMLRPGEYDWWEREMTHFVCSMDGQVWRVIEQGPYKIMDKIDSTKEKKREDYDDADYKCLEKNSKAIRMILQALSEKDGKIALTYKTAKEMWEALKRLYGGNVDVQRNRILAAQKTYQKAVQGKSETLEAFHSRFMSYIGQLNFLGQTYPDWMVTHQFLQALNPSWEPLAMTFQAQSDFKTMSLEELVARLQSNSGLYLRKHESKEKEPDSSKSIALKIDRALELSRSDEPPDEDDPTIALLTRAFKMNNNFRRPKPNLINSGDSKNGNCFRCGKRGHMARDCRVKLKEVSDPKENKKAMVAAWGNSDEEEEVEDEECLMTKEDDSDRKVKPKPSSVTRDDLILALQNMVDKNESLMETIIKLDDEIEGMTDNNQGWVEKANDLEEQLKNVLAIKDSQANKVVGLAERIMALDHEKDNLRSQVADLTEQVEILRNEKTKFELDLLGQVQTMKNELETDFLKRKGSDPNENKAGKESKRMVITSQFEYKNKLRSSTFIKADNLEEEELEQDNVPECSKVAEERSHEGNGPTPIKQEHPFETDEELALKQWKKMKEGNLSAKYDPHKVIKQMSVPPGKSKYVQLKHHMVCTWCGKAGHLKRDCFKKKRDDEKATQNIRSPSKEEDCSDSPKTKLKADQYNYHGTSTQRTRRPRNGQPPKKKNGNTYDRQKYSKNNSNNFWKDKYNQLLDRCIRRDGYGWTYQQTDKQPRQKKNYGHKNKSQGTNQRQDQKLGHRGNYGPRDRPRKAPRKKIELTADINTNAFNAITSTAATLSKPSKPKLVWVRKN